MTAVAEKLAFEACARLPMPSDNVAIATRRLEAGAEVRHGDVTFTLPHTVMEGHRFVLEPTAKGEPLLSWTLPFGIASRDLMPGEYVCNAKILQALAERDIDFELPDEANFTDYMKRYELDESSFAPGEQVALNASPVTFEGYTREGGRGVGTRNFVVVLGTTADSGAFAEQLAARFERASRDLDNVDGVVAVTHTEGSGSTRPNNLDFVLRALAGFMTHANVSAVLAVDYGTGAFGNGDLREFMQANGYPLEHVRHAFFDIENDLRGELDRAEGIINGWLPEVAAEPRTPQPLSNLKVALQCGGSDAFSGISGNALAGWVAKELIRNGGSANLAETDELIGAEPYVLNNVRDFDTARTFLEKIDIFKARSGHHGASAEGNPSGGNNFRGLYNIALKSIGAARKRDPEVRLDYVIDYAAPMNEPGYYFMDSPGNDLESIAGQVASGCNLVLFITGNGSITNFPFVPTLKFVTTSGRFNMLSNEMDVNAGRYNDGESMDSLGRDTFELARRVASGERSKGELAGHAQVSIWRNWLQTAPGNVERLRNRPQPDGVPLKARATAPLEMSFEAYATPRGPALDQVGLVMPTSLCSGQVARLIANERNANADRGESNVTRYVALVHTEGCGAANADDLYLQTLLGHLRHNSVRRALLLEHGCEKTHNDAVRHYLLEHDEDLSRFGFASVQLDGGIEEVGAKVGAWFDDSLKSDGPLERMAADASAIRLGLTATAPGTGAGAMPSSVAEALAHLATGIVAAGGSVVMPENSSLLSMDAFTAELLADGATPEATLAYGEPAEAPGLHVMEAPTESMLETVTGLGGTGVNVMLVYLGRSPVPTHPMIPVLQVSAEPLVKACYGGDLDLGIDAGATSDALLADLTDRLGGCADGTYRPRLSAAGVTGFQLTRGLLGISM